MPELPEVESTVRYLRDKILDSRIVGAEVHWARTIDRPAVRTFQRTLIGSRVSEVTRRGKFIVMKLTRTKKPDCFLLGHLRMSGSMDVIRSTSPLAKHDRVVLRLQNGKDLRFNDPRKFGRFYLVEELTEITGKLGYEPLDAALTETVFFQHMRSKRGILKSLLLDQTFLAGVGNIYADECLWKAGLHPRRTADSVTEEEASLLLRELRATLLEAIDSKGTDAGDGVVEEGLYEPRAYARDGEPCLKCSTVMQRMVVGQRGTHFCPRCQPLRRSRIQRKRPK
ncbi:MAG: bifunctional DNA-formamidopyrimidine glycosylase/DNA-(apurinic or apyrimidinic site) lyase [Deltaproteobacteria bacterium]|nr:bifunctional DNA-formamidopyrimidine glycosylase/DNA-(apurinic or apyrimidinic site) lyase [Deltaproteobacteria bacterium]